MCRGVVLCALLAASLSGADPWCPAYPAERRVLDRARIDLERSAQSYSASAAASKKTPLPVAAQDANLVDGYIFGKMRQDGVTPAPRTSDAEFLRRVTLDLAGRIPSVEEVQQFLASDDPNKRSAWIAALMNSEDFIDNWTLFFGNMFRVTSGYYNLIGISGRDLSHGYLRDFVARDRPYTELATDLITAAGDSQRDGPANFLARAWQQGDPMQDTWDSLTDRITTVFLGVQTQCVSCHNGRGHLEPINLYLSTRRRDEFWRQSAFVSRASFAQYFVDAFNQQSGFIISDRKSGGYHSLVNPNTPGPRPARTGGPYEPVYLFTGEQARNGDWRKELARIVTSDRQFARAAVNYLWAHFFTLGIVEPIDAWDLARIDPHNPPRAPWTLQPSHPELLEALADEFIRSNYSVRQIIRLMVESNAYQISSRYEGQWQAEYARYFAKHFPRRLSAEEVYDAVAKATMTEQPMFVEGFAEPLLWARQLPDPTEPRNFGSIVNFLNQFGRGDWFQVGRSSESTVLQVLFLMNDNMVDFRTFGNQVNSRNTRVALLMEQSLGDDDAVRQLFLATLGRYPTQDEMAAVNKRKNPNREQWLSDTQWVLLNKLDFLFNE